MISDGLEGKELDETMASARLQLRCANADPNYGSLWFHCRKGPIDTARTILSRASGVIFEDLRTEARLYLAAFVRRSAVLAGQPLEADKSREDEACLSFPSLNELTGKKNRPRQFHL